jgi:thiazole synthase
MNNVDDKWTLGGREFSSRFILGSGKYSHELITAAIENAGAEIITLALRRANEGGSENILDYIPEGVTKLPNTSGARDAQEAVRIARLSRELTGSEFVKIEVIHDTKYLLPDNGETVKATEILAKEGFVVMPYMHPDLNVARQLADAGAACIMPLAAPIGSNKGLQEKGMIQIIIDNVDLPVIVDAGIGKPSQAAEAMEMGAAAIMANTGIATASNIPLMAAAFKQGIQAGRNAYLAGLGRVVADGGVASSPNSVSGLFTSSSQSSSQSSLTGFLKD